jgi:L-ascorbate metabolism protein UlaG (beta-lactamase superfamily)
MTARTTLARQVSLAVLTRGRSAIDHDQDLGCSILGPAARAIRRAHQPLQRAVRALGPVESARQAHALVRWLESTPAYDALCQGRRRRLGRRVLRAEVLYPDPADTPPRILHLRRGTLGLDVPVRSAQWPAVNELFAALARGATRSELATFRRVPFAAALLEALRSARWLEAWAAPDPAHAATFVGHHTVALRGHRATVLVDPYFRPAGALDLPGYQPMQARDVGPVDAVLITHAHGDHFHLGSLLQLPPETRLLVPAVERESLFTTDFATRLRQLGFRHVEPMPWGASRRVGDVEVEALPFYGEQPTDARGVHGLENLGNCWKASSPRLTGLFLADSGHDIRGDMAQVCATHRGVDVVFSGVRGFSLRPIFLGFTTLTAFLVDVPRALLDVPQRLMADAETALAWTRLAGARALVPCADGGAPWYWREGMGPRYPGYAGVPVEGASGWDENPDADPFPERVVQLGRALGQTALLLRPGSHLDRVGARLVATASPPFVWPYQPLELATSR